MPAVRCAAIRPDAAREAPVQPPAFRKTGRRNGAHGSIVTSTPCRRLPLQSWSVRIGYGRVSIRDQNPGAPHDALIAMTPGLHAYIGWPARSAAAGRAGEPGHRNAVLSCVTCGETITSWCRELGRACIQFPPSASLHR
jgi:hypothetical protein